MDNAILYKVRVNNTTIEALNDTGASNSVMSCQFYNKLENKPNLIACNRSVSGADRGTLTTAGECFVQLQISNKICRDRVIIIENLKRSYILGQVLHRGNRFGTG